MAGQDDEPQDDLSSAGGLDAAVQKLLRCPFCGGGTSLIRENGKVWLGMRFSEPSSVSVLHHCEPRPGQPSRAIERVGKDLESAIEAWNMRAS